MTFQKFISKFNWRQIFIHFIAFWFFIYAFTTFAFLHDTNLVDMVRNSNQDIPESLRDKTTASVLTDFLIWISLSATIGLLVAFVISLTLSIRRHWFWANSVIAFIIIFVLHWFSLLGWTQLRPFFWYPGQLSNNTKAEFIINGTLLLTIGIFIFFSKQTRKIIERHKQKNNVNHYSQHSVLRQQGATNKPSS